MYKLYSLFLVLVFASFIQSCQKDDMAMSPQMSESSGNDQMQLLAKVGRGMIWADGELFETVATPATFKPDSDPFDEIYAGDKMTSIAEAKPGDQDYNGGRWHVNVLKGTVDPDKYSAATSVDDLDLSDFDSTDIYFECPLLPRRGN